MTWRNFRRLEMRRWLRNSEIPKLGPNRNRKEKNRVKGVTEAGDGALNCITQKYCHPLRKSKKLQEWKQSTCLRLSNGLHPEQKWLMMHKVWEDYLHA